MKANAKEVVPPGASVPPGSSRSVGTGSFASLGGDVFTADLVIVSATPAGIMAAIAAARHGLSVVLLERGGHIGGLPANGLGATDIATREVAAGLFKDFTDRIRDYYAERYGPESEQFEVCSDGFHFEPSVAERVLQQMLAECPGIEVRIRRQFDAAPGRVEKRDGQVRAVKVLNLESGRDEVYRAAAFVDATYEGDLAAAAGVPFTTRREGKADYGEPMAGRVYQEWGGREVGEGSTGEGDETLQAYNFRLCLTDRPENRRPFPKPAGYDRNEYASLIDDLKADRYPGLYVYEREWDGIGRITNIVWLPNGKTDANNQHLAFISTDLPEENYQWPIADWVWRDRFEQRLRNYTLGLFWFMQNDPAVPEPFRTNASRFGLAADEYTDNGNFPRQVYVRAGRRILGEACFLAHDALPIKEGGRPPIHAASVAASHYAVDSHAVRKREPGRVHLDGFLSMRTAPYTVPYGIMVPKTLDNLWVPVAVSASHLGLGTLRMEPCWMALGEAAGVAAALCISLNLAARSVPIDALQKHLVLHGAMLIYYRDVSRDDPAYLALQLLGVRGAIPEWEARLDEPFTEEDLKRWTGLTGLSMPDLAEGATRREALAALSECLDFLPKPAAQSLREEAMVG